MSQYLVGQVVLAAKRIDEHLIISECHRIDGEISRGQIGVHFVMTRLLFSIGEAAG